MDLDNKLSEICGIIVADGCIQKDYLCVWGNINEDREYYDNFLTPLFSKKFNKKLNLHEKRGNSVYGFYLCSRKIVNFLKNNFEFPIGSKTYSIRVPKKILHSKNIKIYSSFIRGFADCDGSLSFSRRKGKYTHFKRKFHFYPRIFLVSASRGLIKDISYMLDYLGIKNSIISGRNDKNRYYRIILRGNNKLNLWMKCIGFKNHVHITKYEIWRKFGFCPPKTTIEERRKILKDKINPYSY